MIATLFIFFLMVLIVFFLFRGLFFLVKDAKHSKRTVKALTLRIALSLTLFFLLILAFMLGLIHPHDLLRNP